MKVSPSLKTYFLLKLLQAQKMFFFIFPKEKYTEEAWEYSFFFIIHLVGAGFQYSVSYPKSLL